VKKPIINTRQDYSAYKISAIDKHILQNLKEKIACSESYSAGPKLLIALAAYLELTDQNLNSFEDPNLTELISGFVAACSSDRLLDVKTNRKIAYFAYLTKLLNHFAPGTPWKEHVKKARLDKARINSFTQRNLNSKALEVWTGWLCTRPKGTTYLPMYQVYNKFGASFTRRLHQTYCNWMEKNDGGTNSTTHFINHIADSKLATEQNLLDDAIATQIIDEFFHSYVRTKTAQKVSITNIAREWTYFHDFATTHLVPAGLLCKTSIPIPKLPIRKIIGRNTNLRKDKDGTVIKGKLLTHFPHDLPLEHDFKALAEKIVSDCRLVSGWADEKMVKIKRKLSRRKEFLFPTTTSDINQNYSPLELRARREFLKLGFMPRSDASNKTPHYCSTKAAEILCLPTSRSLLPLCAVLVHECPQITPSFIENQKIFNMHGQPIGYDRDSGTIDGIKRRRGLANAQQVFQLTPKAQEAMLLIIDITEPVRKYLAEKDDPACQYLLLECGRGFSYPKRVKKLTQATWDANTAKSIAKHLIKQGVSEDDAVAIGKNFTLPALRASVAASTYIKTGSLSKTSSLLGHVKFDSRLLEHYIPHALKEWVQEQRVRGVQEAILAESMGNSEHRLAVSSFDNEEQLQRYLGEHSVQFNREPNPEPDSGHQIYICISTDSLNELRTTRSIYEDETNFYELVRDHIDVNQDCRPDLQQIINSIEKNKK
jgi:hypothetical protein